MSEVSGKRARSVLAVGLVALLSFSSAATGGGGPAAATCAAGELVASAPNFGWPEGRFSVGEDGAAQYTLGLWTPPGRGGVQPEVALNYHSRGGNGLLGVGWSLAGVSSRIAPCPLTFAQDGFRDGVAFNGGDALCLDGNRLVQARPPSGVETEYRTERDAFARIVALGVPGAVPSSFQVWAKDGKILTYGQHSDAVTAQLRAFRLTAGPSLDNPSLVRASQFRETAAWVLQRVQDRNGNAVTIQWQAAEGSQANLWYAQLVPQAIRYAPNRSVVFSYEGRPDPIDGFEHGIHTRTGVRLSRVSMFAVAGGAPAELLREYRLRYQATSITGRSLLSSVTECDGDGVCKLPLEFGWSPGSYEFDVIDTPVTDAGTSDDSGRRVITGDVNRDGLDDLVYPDATNVLRIRRSTGSGFTAPAFSGIHRPTPSPIPPYRSDLRPVDFNRDGRLDMVAEVPLTDTVGKTELALFQSTGTYMPVTPDVDGGHESMSLFVPRDPAYFADLDGNGMPDYATPRQDGPRSFPWHYRLNTGAEGPGRFRPMVATTVQRGISTRVRVLDSDGDGRDELLLLRDTPPDYRYLTFGLSTIGGVETTPVNLARPSPDTAADSRDLTLADVNGDGLADAVYVLTGLRAQLNSGNGFGPLVAGPGPDVYRNPATGHAGFDPGVRVVDFNNDGRDDILVVHGGTPMNPSDHQRGAQLYTWTGGRFVRVPLGTGAGEPTFYGFAATQPLDVDGNGVLDLVHVHGDHLRVLKRRGPAPDQLVRVGVALAGTRVEVQYGTLASGAASSGHAAGLCAYPQVCLTRGGSIVREHRVANGLPGGLNRFTHHYQGARIDATGRGWLGFAKHEVLDLLNNATTVTEIDNVTRHPGIRAYPFAHQPSRTTFTAANHPFATYRRTVTHTRAVRRLVEDRTYTVELRNTVETEQERPIDAQQWPAPLRVRTAQLGYDEFGNQVAAIGGVEQGRGYLDQCEYQNDTSAWLIGKLKRHVAAGCAAGVCRTRVTEHAYDAAGNLRQTVLEPGKPDLLLRTVLERTDHGNVRSVTVSGAAGAARTDTTGYDADDLHTTSTTNALGHTSRIEVDSGLGVPLCTTDPNGVTTAMSYDGFGRLRETVHADGSFERVNHLNFLGVHIVSTTRADGGGTTTALDMLGRPAQVQARAFDGRSVFTYTEYDAMGRVARVSRPTFGGETAQYTSFAYDRRDRLVSRTEPDSATVRHEYDGLRKHTYDARDVHSLLVETVDGDVGSRYEDDPRSTGLLRTRVTYGPFGEATGIVAPDGTSQTMTYDLLGRRTGHRDPSAGTTTSTYNAFGELLTESDGDGGTTTYRYDALGRPTRAASPDGVATNTWDTAANGIGLLATARSADGVLTRYTYDPLARAATTTWTIEGTGYEVGYGYDDVGRISTTTYPRIPGAAGRLTVGYAYNRHGYLTQAVNSADGTVYWQVDGRDAAGQAVRERYGSGVVSDHQYHPATGLPVRRTTTGPGADGVIDEMLLIHDANRNVIGRDNPVRARRDRYGYDGLNRLTSWRLGRGRAVDVSTAYAYDVVGNLVAETVAGQPDRDLVYRYGESGAPPHALTSRNSQQYGYDGAGRQVSAPQRTVRYNAAGLPKALTWGQGQRSEFAYDAAGARVVKRDAGQVTVSVPGLFERRTPAGTGGSEIHNIHNVVVDGRAVAQVNRVQAAGGGPVTATRTSYLHADQQGSTTLVTNAAGKPLGEDDTWLGDLFYSPFGERVDAEGKPLGRQRRGGPRLGFTGHEHDDELGLVNMAGRVYDPAQRRFLTPDPLVAEPLSSQGHNRYSYVRNNPATLTDPTGMWGVPFLDWLFGPDKDQDEMVATADAMVRLSEPGTTAKGEAIVVIGRAEPTPRSDDESGANPEDVDAVTKLQHFASGVVLGALQPSLVGAYDKRAYVADHWDFSNRRAPTMQYMADRLAARWGYTATHLNFWTWVATAPVSGYASASGEVLGGFARGAARARGQVLRQSAEIITHARSPIGRAVRTAMADSTVTLLQMRTAAVEATEFIDMNRVSRMSPTEFGNMADAFFKGSVLRGIDEGVLPRTLQVTPRFVRGPDVWDAATGLAWDLTTATVRQVAGHDRQYIGTVMQGPHGPVKIRDVIPLVYGR